MTVSRVSTLAPSPPSTRRSLGAALLRLGDAAAALVGAEAARRLAMGDYCAVELRLTGGWLVRGKKDTQGKWWLQEDTVAGTTAGQTAFYHSAQTAAKAMLAIEALSALGATLSGAPRDIITNFAAGAACTAGLLQMFATKKPGSYGG